MSLKQSIVIKNRFSVKTAAAPRGTRGGTPGQFVMRYMSRPDAVENITPTRLKESDSFDAVYESRDEAGKDSEYVPEMKHRMRKTQKKGGAAFGYGDIALSDEKLRVASDDIQKNFDNGHTVMETVISFDGAYLLEHGILDPDYEYEKRGDFRGHVDQLKLRMAIMKGMDRVARSYDDLQYVGVIQVDTRHIHCHIAAVDRGRGTLMPDGTQKGKFSSDQMMQLRRGIDLFLDQKQPIKMLTSSVDYDKRNALGYIKNLSLRTVEKQGIPQFLLACLPENKNYWRASSNRREMQKPNEIVRTYVNELLSRPDSGYADAQKSVREYAEYRLKNEGLTEQQYNELVRRGDDSIVESCMNGVYSVLKRIPDDEINTETKFMDTMSMNYEDLASESNPGSDPMLEFAFKLRSYSSREDYHRKQYHKFDDLVEAYKNTDNPDPAAEPLAVYCQMEAEYNEMLMCKYQYFLSFLPDGMEDGTKQDFRRRFDHLMDRRKALADLELMNSDTSIRRFKTSEAAEEYGMKVYHQRGARRIQQGQDDIMKDRIERLRQRVNQETHDLNAGLRDYGFTFDGEKVVKYRPYAFNDVKALDLHHMGYDFPYDARVSVKYINQFTDMADKRFEACQKAMDYLKASGQEDSIRELPIQDVKFMKDYADSLRISPSLASARTEAGQKRRRKTISLDHDYDADIEHAVKAVVDSLEFE